MTKHILVIEDEAAIREMVCLTLMQHGFHTLEAESYADAQRQLCEPLPSLVLLDWMLPGGSGLQLLKFIRYTRQTRDIPVLMLTARGEEEERVRGLDAGADDYMTKPFSPKELVARVKALLRRVSPAVDKPPLEALGLLLDPISHLVDAAGKALDLGPTEFRLLHFFMSHPERVYSREHLLDNVWGNNVYVEDRTVDVHIRRLRRVLEASGHDRMIQTVRGAGYRFSTRV